MNHSEMTNIEQICIIANFGLGSKLLKAAKQYGATGGTVLLGKGTVNNPLLDLLGLSDVRKEMVIIVAAQETARRVMEKLNEEFKFEKPNHGIAFTTSICSVIGTSGCKNGQFNEGRGADSPMYHAITVIVDKGKAEYVIDAATRAGSKGGTVINARGSGIHETGKLFSMEIEPEKEIVIILTETEKTDAIVALIRDELKIDEPGKGILYVQEVNQAYGIRK